jgi:AcrR family transcriptional regulator
VSRAPLTKERVLAKAITIADRRGIAVLSMRKLAEELKVEAMSLYHHFANKDQILAGMIDAVFAEIELPRAADWKTAMRRRAISAREVLSRHRWAVGLMDSPRNPGMATLRHHDAVIGALRGGGFTITMAAHAFSLLDSYIYGFVLQEQSLPFSNAEEMEAVAGEILEHLPTEELPYFSEMVEHALEPGYAYTKEFGFGLDLILDALERLVTAPSKRRSARRRPARRSR